jgi:hypothetical protein
MVEVRTKGVSDEKRGGSLVHELPTGVVVKTQLAVCTFRMNVASYCMKSCLDGSADGGDGVGRDQSMALPGPTMSMSASALVG